MVLSIAGTTQLARDTLQYPLVPWQSLTYVKKNGLEKEVVILVLELAVGGELFDFMMYTGAFPEVIARTYFAQVSLTLNDSV